MARSKLSVAWRILERAARPPERRRWKVYFGDRPLLDKRLNPRRFSSTRAATKAAKREVMHRTSKPKVQGPGSRLLLWECQCEKPVKVRHAGQDLKAKCLVCGHRFRLVESSLPPTQQGE